MVIMPWNRLPGTVVTDPRCWSSRNVWTVLSCMRACWVVLCEAKSRTQWLLWIIELDIRKKFVQWEWWGTGIGFPEMWGMLHPWGLSRRGWIRLWALQWSWTRLPLKALSNSKDSTILWFYDSCGCLPNWHILWFDELEFGTSPLFHTFHVLCFQKASQICLSSKTQNFL